MKSFYIISLIFYSINIFAQKQWTLKECVDYATEHNLSIESYTLSEKNYENQLQVSKNNWLPTVDGSFDNSVTIGVNNPATNKSYQQYGNNLGLRSSINLYQGGTVHLNEEKAKLELASSKLATQNNINDISLLVVNYYLNIVLNRELKQIAEGNLTINKQQLDRVQKQYNVGTVARADLAQAEANVAQEKKNVADAQIEVERALFNLAILLQLPDYRVFDIVMIPIPNDISLGLYDLEQITNTAYANQSNIQKAKIDLEVAQKNTELTKASFKPSVTGSYSLGTSYADYFNKGLKSDAWLNQWYDNITNVFSVSVSVPIFTKHNNKLNVEQSKINEEIAQNLIEQEKQNLLKNVQEAYFNVNSSYQAYEVAKENVRSSEVSFDFADKSFKAGVINIYDFNIARNNLTIAKSQMIQAKYNFIFRQKVLDFYAGIPLIE